ncbi:cytochrome c oxidase subunit 6b-1-like [Neodiprion virginianus]|uniref:cytochrome c oxidase subunit 6b-1-like n=1 Tax=Neodiprion virginianus TaxID=2961670 RepID=UPI001EE727EE|nr:cytochrome c oxidase subunit 6b-1-like [Neodiprion virginianus]
MSEPNKGDDTNTQNATEPDQQTVPKKYPSHITQSHKSVKTDRGISKNANESATALTDSPPEILTQVAQEPTQPEVDLSKLVNVTSEPYEPVSSPKIDSNPDSKRDENPPLEQVPKHFSENKISLGLIEVADKKEGKKKINRNDLTEEELDEICAGRDGNGRYTKTRTPGLDPRFQQTNQTLRCFVMYTDFYRCENILGEGKVACQWFKDVFTSICPLDWVRKWDEAREAGRMPWSKGNSQGNFPGHSYGD